MYDDLGYGELGAYGQKIIETKNIDELAKNGLMFTNFYSGSPVCAPSRSILLTGLHGGHTKIRGNHEYGSRGDVWDYKKCLMIQKPWKNLKILLVSNYDLNNNQLQRQ